jgi:hypothetical protein
MPHAKYSQDPFNQPAILLRLTGPGYNSLPNFTLTAGTLSTIAQAPFGGGLKVYNSNLALDESYVLTVDGEKEGWTICDGVLDYEVLSWKGTAEGCQATYVHAVKKAPY